jgi:hypothetical protein
MGSTANNSILFMSFIVRLSFYTFSIFNFSFADFCHDSAKQASLMALAAPKVQFSARRLQRFTLEALDLWSLRHFEELSIFNCPHN